MSSYGILVYITSPARSIRYNQVAINDFRWAGDQIVFPRYVIDVDFHDAEVR